MIIGKDKNAALIERFVKMLRSKLSHPIIAVDGQAVRASRNSTEHSPYVLNIMDADNELILAQQVIGEKNNEITHATKLISTLDIQGAIVTADALNTQTEFAAKFIAEKADYCLALKANQDLTYEQVRPLIIFCTFLCCTSFYFQNVIAPKAQIKLLTLLVSMKQTSPELDIPEGVFYDEIEGYNIYVKQKDRETGMLKDVLIYNFSDGFENAHIIWASEGKMEMTADKQHLYLHLYNGEQFENLKSQTISSNNVPYRRETFREKHTIIEFDGGFNMVDGSFLSDRSDSKNMIEISQSIDSLNHRADSLGRSMYNEIKASTYRNIVLSKTDSAKIVETNNKINVDSLFNSYTLAEKDKTLGSAADRTEALASEWSMKSYQTTDADNNIRKHEADWHKKITLSLSCLIFFFIGAPLGAIIRKGGLGMPVVVSVLIFVIYYIIDSGATRVAKSGEMNMVLGVWMSTIVLAPITSRLGASSGFPSCLWFLLQNRCASLCLHGTRLPSPGSSVQPGSEYRSLSAVLHR